MRLLSRALIVGAVTAFAGGLTIAGASTPASATGYYYKRHYGYYHYKPYYKPHYYNYYYKKRFHH